MSEIWIWSFGNTQGGSSLDIVGYRVEATDGNISEVESATFDGGSGSIVVDTGFWIFGKRRMVPGGLVARIDEPSRTIYRSCSKAVVTAAPDHDPALHGDANHRAAVTDAFAPSR